MNAMKKARLRGAIATQREVAKFLGVAEATVSKWETGAVKPRAEKLSAIARLYGCTIEDLLADEVTENVNSGNGSAGDSGRTRGNGEKQSAENARGRATPKGMA